MRHSSDSYTCPIRVFIKWAFLISLIFFGQCIQLHAQVVKTTTSQNTIRAANSTDVTGIIAITNPDYSAMEQTAGGNLLQNGVVTELWQVAYQDKPKAAGENKQTVNIYLKQKITQAQVNMQRVESGIKYTISGVPNMQNLVVLTYFSVVPPQKPFVNIISKGNDGSGRQFLAYLSDARKIIGQDKIWGIHSIPGTGDRTSLNFPTTFSDGKGMQTMNIFEDMGDIFEDAVDGIGKAVEGAAGVFINAAGSIVIQVGEIIYNVIAYGNLPKFRTMSEGEYRWANEKIFNGTLPTRSTIIITNLMSLDRRQYTIPNGTGQIYMNLGDGYDNPMAYARPGYDQPGQVFIHELGHAWQIEHHMGTKAVSEGLSNIAKGPSAYDYTCGKGWNDYNFEQQAHIIDICFLNRDKYNSNKSCEQTYVEQNVRFSVFPTAPAPVPTQGAKNITAVSRIKGSLETFWIDKNGSVQAAYWYEGDFWRRYELAPPGSASPNGGITAVSRIPGSIEVWFVGSNGSIQDKYFYEGKKWAGFELAPAGSASLTSNIAAVSRIPGSLEIWYVGANGSLQDKFWYEGKNWAGFELAPAGSVALAGGLACVSRIRQSLEVWYVAANGSVQDKYWYEGKNWAGFELAPAGSASLTGGLAGIARIPGSLEIWYVGANGSIQDKFWYEGKNWAGFELAPAGSASLNSSIKTISRIQNSMELWYVGPNGSIQDKYWYAGGAWKGFELAPAGSAVTNSGLAAVARVPGSLECWFIGGNNSVQDKYWYEGKNWTGFELAPTR